MNGDEGYSRFFAYMNLFVASMVTLVLADNLLLLYLGWEGVGLCSYLLIGFWYTDPVNGLAARKAFIVTRVGDTAMTVGLFLLYSRLGRRQSNGLRDRYMPPRPRLCSWVEQSGNRLNCPCRPGSLTRWPGPHPRAP
jgi:NADH-quinone oxidoreductase subunit L